MVLSWLETRQDNPKGADSPTVFLRKAQLQGIGSKMINSSLFLYGFRINDKVYPCELESITDGVK